MSTKYGQDAELNALMAKLAERGELVDRLVELLIAAELPEIEVNGQALAAPNPPISDKSCYKKCLRDCLDPNLPTTCYSDCIKKCKKKVKLSFEFAF